jgi:hypothetical protein
VFISSSFVNFFLFFFFFFFSSCLALTPKTDFKHKKGKNHERVVFSRLTNSKSPGELMLHALSRLRLCFEVYVACLRQNVRCCSLARIHACSTLSLVNDLVKFLCCLRMKKCPSRNVNNLWMKKNIFLSSPVLVSFRSNFKVVPRNRRSRLAGLLSD